MAVFRGVGVALATLFDERHEVDAPATAELATRLCALGVRGVVVAGTTGEAATLTPQERTALLDAVRSSLPAPVPVIAGTGAPSARQAVELTRSAVEHGADAVLVLPPPGSRDLPDYFGAVADAAAGVPVLGYHFPAVSAPGIPVSMLAHLPIEGCKDSSGDVNRLLEELEWVGALYTGSSGLLALAGPLGITGAILGLANLRPEECVRAFGGDIDAQRALVPEHLAVGRGGPAALKELMAVRFGTSRVARVA